MMTMRGSRHSTIFIGIAKKFANLFLECLHKTPDKFIKQGFRFFWDKKRLQQTIHFLVKIQDDMAVKTILIWRH